MDFKVRINYGWHTETFYYSREEQARHVCEWAVRDGNTATLYRRTSHGWEEIELKGEQK